MTAARRGARRRPLVRRRPRRCGAPTSPCERGRDRRRHGPERLGKSTLLHCLAGILVPRRRARSGSTAARIDTLGETERSALRRDRFGFVFQFGQLVPELTAEENVALPLLLGGVRRAAALAGRPAPGSTRLGLDGLERRRSGELSGGQAQRVALARGLVAEPEVLFADEPTGALDSLTGEQVMDLLVGTAREQGTTVVLVTHEPRVAAYADREVVVRDGRVTPAHRPGRRRDPLRAAAHAARRPGGRRSGWSSSRSPSRSASACC